MYGPSTNVFCQYCPRALLTGKKTSGVEQSGGAFAKLSGRRPPPHWTGKGQLNEGVLFGELSVLLFVCFRWMGYCGVC